MKKATKQKVLPLGSWSVLPPRLAVQLTFLLLFLQSPKGRTFAKEARACWLAIRNRVRTAIEWQDPRVVSDAALAFFSFSEKWPTAFTFTVDVAPRPLLGGELAVLLAIYNGEGPQEASAELIRVAMRLRAAEELVRRASKHPLGALLFVAAAGRARDLDQAVMLSEVRDGFTGKADRAAVEWFRRTALTLSIVIGKGGSGRLKTAWTRQPRPGALPPGWLHGVLGEADPVTTREEALGLLGVRLVEVRKFLSRLSLEELAAKPTAGLLNFHRSAARQAVLGGQKQKWERHLLTDDLDAAPDRDRHRQRVRRDAHVVGPREGAHTRPHLKAPDPLDETERQAWDPDAIADKIAHWTQMTDGERRVFRIYCLDPKKPKEAIAEEADVAGKTLSRALTKAKKLGKRSLRRLVYLS